MPLRILVIDDELSIRSSLCGYLEDFGYDVLSTDTAESGLELIRDIDFDVVIADLRLPKMSGDMMIIKAHTLKPGLCFLIHTGSVDYELSKDLRNIGVLPEHVLHKPQPDLHNFIEQIKKLTR